MKAVSPVIALFSVALLPGCASLDWQRAAHDILQQASCEQREPRGSCNRSWEEEYRTLQRQRAGFLKALEDENKITSTAGWLQPFDASSLPEL